MAHRPSMEQILGMALIGTSEVRDNTDYEFDGLIICDANDYDDLKISLEPLMENENTSLCYVFDGKEPNTTLCRNVDCKREKSRCVIFYISENFCVNEDLKYVTECVAKSRSTQKTISLITNETIQHERFLWLAQSVSIYQSSDNWLFKLSKEIKPQPLPLFCEPIVTGSVASILQSKGLSLSRLKWDMHGVIVQMGKQVLQVDLDIFALHVEVHQKLKTSEVCAECSELRTGDTSVELMLQEKTASFSSIVEKCTNDLANLCSCVMDVMEPYKNNTIWTLGCTITGKPIEDNALLKRLFNTIHYRLAEKGLSSINKKFHPNYSTEESRIESFEGKWSSEKLPTVIQLAEAGLFFSKAPQETRCFHCGVCIIAWDTHDEPWLKHAGICPYCPYIKSKMSVERIEEAKQLAEHEYEHKVSSNIYNSIDARIKSFHTFDTKHLKNFETCGKNRDELIEEFAEAGFYFNGSVDLVKCFSCGLVLSSINPEDDLSFIHAKTYPDCNYIVNLLGKKTVQVVLRTARNEAVDKKSHLAFLLRTLDNKPRREWPPNIFRPV